MKISRRVMFYVQLNGSSELACRGPTTEQEEAEKLLFDFFKLCLFGWKQYDDDGVEWEERFPCQKHDACLLQLQILSTMDTRVEAREKKGR